MPEDLQNIELGQLEQGVQNPERRAFLGRIINAGRGALAFAVASQLPACKGEESVAIEDLDALKTVGIEYLNKEQLDALCSHRLIVKERRGKAVFEDSDGNIVPKGSVKKKSLMGSHRVLRYRRSDGDFAVDRPEDGLEVGQKLDFARILRVPISFEDGEPKPGVIDFAGRTLRRGKGKQRYQMKLDQVNGKHYLVMFVRGRKFVCPVAYEDLKQKDQKLAFIYNYQISTDAKAKQPNEKAKAEEPEDKPQELERNEAAIEYERIDVIPALIAKHGIPEKFLDVPWMEWDSRFGKRSAERIWKREHKLKYEDFYPMLRRGPVEGNPRDVLTVLCMHHEGKESLVPALKRELAIYPPKGYKVKIIEVFVPDNLFSRELMQGKIGIDYSYKKDDPDQGLREFKIKRQHDFMRGDQRVLAGDTSQLHGQIQGLLTETDKRWAPYLAEIKYSDRDKRGMVYHDDLEPRYAREASERDKAQFRGYLDQAVAASHDKLVVLNVSAKDCRPCKKTAPHFTTTANWLHDQGRAPDVAFHKIDFKGIAWTSGYGVAFEEFMKDLGVADSGFGFPQYVFLYKGRIVRYQSGIEDLFASGGSDAAGPEFFINLVNRCINDKSVCK